MLELTENYDVIQLRKEQAKLFNIVTKAKTFEDLAEIDDLKYWKLIKDEIGELSADVIVSLMEDKHIDSALIYYNQWLLNTAYKIVEPEREDELDIIKRASSFKRQDSINHILKYVTDWLIKKQGTTPYFELNTLLGKVQMMQKELEKREQSLQMSFVQQQISQQHSYQQEIERLSNQVAFLTQKVQRYESFEGRLSAIELRLGKASLESGKTSDTESFSHAHESD